MKRLCCVLCVLSCLAAAESAMAADEGRVEIAGSYEFLRDGDASRNLQGGAVTVAIAAAPWLAVVGEVGTGGTTVPLPTDVALHVHAFLAGPRYTVRPRASVALFGQVLFGAASSNAVTDGVETSSTDLAIQPGGGVDISIAPKWAVRFQGDYRAIRASVTMVKQERFMAGLVFHP
jgi:hypothetical protein